MTVSSDIIKKSYAGNDVATEFAYTWKIYDESDLLVVLRDSDGNETPQVLNTDYTVSGVGDGGGGNVTMVAAPATGETLVIKLDLDFIQETDWVENTDFPASSHEDAADRVVKLTQILNEKLGRAALLSLSSALTGLTLPKKDGSKVYIRWNVGGTDLETAMGTAVASFADLIDGFDLSGNAKKHLRVNDAANALTPSVMTEEADHFDFKTKKIKAPAIDLTAPAELTIASGVVAVTQGCHSIDTEEDAASDELDTVNDLEAGQFYFFTPANGARTVVIKHNTGNIWIPTGTDLSLDDALDGVLAYSPDGSNLIVLTIFTSSDANAIHGNAPGEIQAISEKTSLAAADLFLIEDSAASYAKKKVQGTNVGQVVGSIIMWAGDENSPPTGWLLCDGSAVSRSTYATLFSTIGTTYGVGDGSTTFNLPDLRGRFPLGVNNSDLPNGADGGLSTRDRADEGGEEEHTLTQSEMPAHTHSIPMSSIGGGATDRNDIDGGAGTNTGSTGGGSAHENMPPFNVVNFLIKT